MANCSRLIVLLLALFAAPFSYAGIETLFDRQGFAIYPATNMVSAQTVGNLSGVAANGSRALVPATTAVQVSRATMALNAAKLARVLSPVGAAFTAYAIYDAVKSTGVTTCAAPDFFCMPGATTPALYPSGWAPYGATTPKSNTANEACTLKATTAGYPPSYLPTSATPYPGEPTRASCRLSQNTVIGDVQVINTAEAPACTAPSTMVNGSCVSPGGSFQSDQALADSMQANDWNGTVSKNIWDAVQADMSKSPGTLSFKDALGANSPVTVSGSPVTTPQVTTSIKTSPNPDGSTSTEVRKEQTTFTPGKDGSTVADAVPKLSQSTTVITTTTNNTTNVTNTTNETQTPPKSAAEEQIDFCKQNPDIVACKTLGPALTATPVPNTDKAVTITASTGWGASNGACPAPGSFTAMGKTIPVPWDVFCQFAQGIRPFLIAVGYMIAVGGFLGLSRKD